MTWRDQGRVRFRKNSVLLKDEKVFSSPDSNLSVLLPSALTLLLFCYHIHYLSSPFRFNTLMAARKNPSQRPRPVPRPDPRFKGRMKVAPRNRKQINRKTSKPPPVIQEFDSTDALNFIIEREVRNKLGGIVDNFTSKMMKRTISTSSSAFAAFIAMLSKPSGFVLEDLKLPLPTNFDELLAASNTFLKKRKIRVFEEILDIRDILNSEIESNVEQDSENDTGSNEGGNSDEDNSSSGGSSNEDSTGYSEGENNDDSNWSIGEHGEQSIDDNDFST